MLLEFKEDARNAWFAVYVGKAGSARFNGNLVKVQSRYLHGRWRLYIVMSDGVSPAAEPENPKRFIALDPGKKNFLAAVTNTGSVPFVVKGGAVNAMNCRFNEERARLLSELTRGKDSTRSVKNSKELDRISHSRECQLRDFFYKIAHAVCRYASRERIDMILVGHNKGQKDEISLGKKGNREFVPIPFERFIGILKRTAAKYGIFVKEREESYTSKASMLDFDDIPTYREGDKAPHSFSGKRVKRGLYMSKNGTLINADINAAANLIRKECSDAFMGQKDLSYLYKTVDVLDYRCIYNQTRSEKTGKAESQKHSRGRSSCVSRHDHAERWKKKTGLMKAFDAGKKVWQLKKKESTGKAA